MNSNLDRFTSAETALVGALRTSQQFLTVGELEGLVGVPQCELVSQLQQMTDNGWPIEHCPHRGFRFAPCDQLDADAIEGRLRSYGWIGRSLVIRDFVGSTNDEAAALARDGAPSGLVVVADCQLTGRGRLGRLWSSPAGVNLYFSVLIRPAWPAAYAPPLSLIVGVALARALQREGQDELCLKWPNDVLIKDRKVCGVLVESHIDGDQVRHAVIGIGLNVNQKRFPPELRERATSLCGLAGDCLSRCSILSNVLNELETCVDAASSGGSVRLLDEWTNRAKIAGKVVRITNPGSAPIEGTALGVTTNGALQILEPDGGRREILCGDVTLSAK